MIPLALLLAAGPFFGTRAVRQVQVCIADQAVWSYAYIPCTEDGGRDVGDAGSFLLCRFDAGPPRSCHIEYECQDPIDGWWGQCD